MSLAGRPWLLKPSVQNYAWGKIGDTSVIYHLVQNTTPQAGDQPIAELWIGDHPNGPSTVLDPEHGDVLLSARLQTDPSVLYGATRESVPASIGAKLPYLFKILSVNKALSIQAHPDKSLARKLHSSRPDVYKDDNHKPEMAIALTDFEALCQFRPIEEISAHLQSYPELRAVVGEECVQSFLTCSSGANPTDPSDPKSALRSVYTTIMNCNEGVVAQHVSALVARLKALPNLDNLQSLLIRLDSQYPGDVGVFSALLLNYIVLKPGQALFLAANEPHAYLDGNCVECMAASDNVVRGGCTPKLKDVDILCSMLTYNTGHPTVLEGDNRDGDAYSRDYVPPVPEFKIIRTTMPASVSDYTFKASDTSWCGIVTEGSGSLQSGDHHIPLAQGSIVFVPAGLPAVLGSGIEGLTMYSATAGNPQGL